MRHSGAILNLVLRVSVPSFESMPQYCRHFLPILHQFLHCPSDLEMEYFESHSSIVSIMGVIAFLVFLIFPWLPQYSIYMLNETLSLLRSLYLSIIVSFKDGSFPLPLKISPFQFSHQKPKNLVSSAG